MVVSESLCLLAISLFNMWPRAFAKNNLYFHHISYSVKVKAVLFNAMDIHAHQRMSQNGIDMIQLWGLSIIPYQRRFFYLFVFCKNKHGHFIQQLACCAVVLN